MTTTDHEHTPQTEAELGLLAHYWTDAGADAYESRAVLRLITEVRRLWAERSADSERLAFLLRHKYTTTIWPNSAELDVEELGEETFIGNDIYGCIDQAMVAEADAARQEPTP